MKIYLTKNPSNISLLMRRLSYHPDKKQKKDSLSFSKRLGSADYPKYHIYINKDNQGKTYLHLHLDMKQPSYKNIHAHSAEYEDSAWLNQEKERIENLLKAVDN
jgi:hypothetical protein